MPSLISSTRPATLCVAEAWFKDLFFLLWWCFSSLSLSYCLSLSSGLVERDGDRVPQDRGWQVRETVESAVSQLIKVKETDWLLREARSKHLVRPQKDQKKISQGPETAVQWLLQFKKSSSWQQDSHTKTPSAKRQWEGGDMGINTSNFLLGRFVFSIYKSI